MFYRLNNKTESITLGKHTQQWWGRLWDTQWQKWEEQYMVSSLLMAGWSVEILLCEAGMWVSVPCYTDQCSCNIVSTYRLGVVQAVLCTVNIPITNDNC